ncbi:MAG: recombinase family protein [bacterium]|nr:recombinase family protein [bacterium]
MKIAYIRVSTIEQNEARQYEALKSCGIEKFYSEKISGKNTDRPKFKEMMEAVREGDTIYVEDFSRLARSTEDLLRIVRELNDKGIGLVSMKENLDTKTPTGELMLTVIAAINQFERKNMLERQKEGIAIAKEKGIYKGRKAIPLPEDFGFYYEKWMRQEMSKAEIARTIGVSRPTCDKFFTEYGNQRRINLC